MEHRRQGHGDQHSGYQPSSHRCRRGLRSTNILLSHLWYFTPKLLALNPIKAWLNSAFGLLAGLSRIIEHEGLSGYAQHGLTQRCSQFG